MNESWNTIINKKDKSKRKKEDKLIQKEEKGKINKEKEEVFNFPLEYAWNNSKKINYNKYLYEENRHENKKGFVEIDKGKKEIVEENKFNKDNWINKGTKHKINENEENKIKNKNKSEKEIEDFGISYPEDTKINENLISSNFKEISPKIFLEEHALVVEYNLFILNNKDYRKIIPALNVGVFVVEIKNRLKYLSKLRQKKKVFTGYLEITKECDQEFNKILEYENKIKRFDQFENLEIKLFILLKKVVMIIDGWKFLQSENSEKIVNFSEITIVRSKLHKQM
uniref:Uncharacterized protein n=1 Tax=Meloidogyne enterolobii TaxID=390850 RepID=A0A6V7X4W3_MELEN|nr:unnamed protein product [Meloidogyne enterolobii]